MSKAKAKTHKRRATRVQQEAADKVQKAEEIQIDMFELERRYAVFEEWLDGIAERYNEY